MPIILLLAAASALQPGLWIEHSDPGIATIDGKPLAELPISPMPAQRLCITPAQARDLAGYFTRDTAATCTVTTSSVKGGKVAIAGSCPAEGSDKTGLLHITGRYAAKSFALKFETTNPQPEGVMGFSGTMTGKRVGKCPVGGVR